MAQCGRTLWNGELSLGNCRKKGTIATNMKKDPWLMCVAHAEELAGKHERKARLLRRNLAKI